ncbi:hypothetical protein RYX36_013954, partial [Vicia faba]
PKKSRSTVQASTSAPYGKLKKNPYRIQTAEALSHKVKSLLLVDSLKRYQENFLDKHVDPEYYVDATSQNELRMKFLQPFSYANLLTFIGLKIMSGNHSMSWEEYIVVRMVYFGDTKKDLLFYSSFIQCILEANKIVPKEDDQFITLKILDYGGVSKMRYFLDSDDGSYFYHEDSGRKVYDNKIVDPPIDPIVAPTSSTPFGSFPIESKSYLDNIFGILMDDNQIIEDRIKARIYSVARETEGRRVQLKANLRVKLKDEILAYEGRVASQIEFVKASLDHLGSCNYIFPAEFTDDVVDIPVSFLDDPIAPHSTFDPG